MDVGVNCRRNKRISKPHCLPLPSPLLFFSPPRLDACCSPDRLRYLWDHHWAVAPNHILSSHTYRHTHTHPSGPVQKQLYPRVKAAARTTGKVYALLPFIQSAPLHLPLAVTIWRKLASSFASATFSIIFFKSVFEYLLLCFVPPKSGLSSHRLATGD